jgi:H+-transporting ATPase
MKEINVKMVTGDNRAISKRIAEEVGLKGECFVKTERTSIAEYNREDFDRIAAFSEVLPRDKLDITMLGKRYYKVAVTGDGINDLPSLKSADVSIGVSNAVDSVKSMADIILLTPGITAIKDAILESRKIFWKVYSYSVYRISESFRVILAILVLGLIFGYFPLTPVQLILLALLNDIPIISLAFNRVKNSMSPSKLKIKNRIIKSIFFGLVGLTNSLFMFLFLNNIMHFSIETIQTFFFLKLVVSGHMLVFVSHTKEVWYNYLPSKEVILATISTQVIATIIAVAGFFMPPISIGWALFVWLWAFVWMQVGEVTKGLSQKD